MRRACLLFDLDTTLMVSDGAGSAAMSRAFQEGTRVADALAGVDFHGRTDRWIVNEVARRSGADAAQLWYSYRRDYPPLLREELAVREPRVLPGVRELLDALDLRDDTAYCLATGNQREASFIKLASVELDGYFVGGGFGDRHEQRADMLREAMLELEWWRGERLVVIGDSEHDVTAAQAVDAVAVAVATGNRSEQQLAAIGADVVLPDLGDLERALEAVLG